MLVPFLESIDLKPCDVREELRRHGRENTAANIIDSVQCPTTENFYYEATADDHDTNQEPR